MQLRADAGQAAGASKIRITVTIVVCTMAASRLGPCPRPEQKPCRTRCVRTRTVQAGCTGPVEQSRCARARGSRRTALHVRVRDGRRPRIRPDAEAVPPDPDCRGAAPECLLKPIPSPRGRGGRGSDSRTRHFRRAGHSAILAVRFRVSRTPSTRAAGDSLRSGAEVPWTPPTAVLTERPGPGSRGESRWQPTMRR